MHFIAMQLFLFLINPRRIQVDYDTLRQAVDSEPDASLRRRIERLLTDQSDDSEGR